MSAYTLFFDPRMLALATLIDHRPLSYNRQIIPMAHSKSKPNRFKCTVRAHLSSMMEMRLRANQTSEPMDSELDNVSRDRSVYAELRAHVLYLPAEPAQYPSLGRSKMLFRYYTLRGQNLHCPVGHVCAIPSNSCVCLGGFRVTNETETQVRF